MTCRVESGVTFKQTYNAENRISTIQKLASGTCASPGALTAHWAFSYDGDGTRVSTLYTPYVSGQPQTSVLTAYYMGGAYEVTGSAVKKYYSVAGMMVAMNDGTGLQYLLTDHLGSTVAVTNSSGTLTSQQRYLPFGAPRTISNSPILGTDFGYTGQRKLDDGMGGIMDYKARFYSPYINRFLQPDTIISNPTNPQAFNRYGYVLNNPIRYNDPSGHVCSDPDDPTPSCDGGGSPPPNNPAPLPSAPVVITNPDPLDDGLRIERNYRNLSTSGDDKEDCRVPSCVDVPDFVTSSNPQFPLYNHNECLDMYFYNICGSITTDTVIDDGSLMTMSPNQAMLGNVQTGQFGFALNNGLVMWLPALAIAYNNVTTFTRIGMQYSPFNTQSVAGQSVVSMRNGNVVQNIRGNMTIEYRPQNFLQAFAVWNLGGLVAAFPASAPVIGGIGCKTVHAC